MIEVILKRFEAPDEVRVFEKGRLEVVRIGAMTVGRASYEPGFVSLHFMGAEDYATTSPASNSST